MQSVVIKHHPLILLICWIGFFPESSPQEFSAQNGRMESNDQNELINELINEHIVGDDRNREAEQIGLAAGAEPRATVDSTEATKTTKATEFYDRLLVSVLEETLGNQADEVGEKEIALAGFHRLAEAEPPAIVIGDDRRRRMETQLVVKFRDDLGARADRGVLRFLANEKLQQEHRGWIEQFSQTGIRFEPLLQLSENLIWYLEFRATAVSGLPQPDLASMLVVRGSEPWLTLAAFELAASDLVQWVEFEMLAPPPPIFDDPCSDIPPATPNYTHLQGYRGPNPGLNMNAFWQRGNAKGNGIRVADCEYGYNGNHEDLCGIIPEPDQTIHPTVISNNWHEHGTAVMGELVGGENLYGITGLVPEAEAYFFTEWSVEQGLRRATCIANAIAAMNPGDVVLLEMQTSILGGDLYGPAELNSSVWTIVKNGVDGGVIVVGAAGNGNQNLDGPDYQAYRQRGDSGAIIVGAGTANLAHNKLNFSTYGNRVNVQGWGQSVFTTGYGGYAQIGGDFNQRYTATFSGTSSASPFVAAACVGLQSFAVANLGRRLTPAEMRQVLTETGHPQGTGGNIGPFPDLQQAADSIVDQWGLIEILPEEFSVDIGRTIAGDLADLHVADENYLILAASSKWTPPVTRLPEQEMETGSLVAQVDLSGTIPILNPGYLEIVMAAFCDAKGVEQRIELYNFSNRSYQSVDVRPASSRPGSSTRLVIDNPSPDFFEENTGQIRARLTFVSPPDRRRPGWQAWIDQSIWIVKK